MPSQPTLATGSPAASPQSTARRTRRNAAWLVAHNPATPAIMPSTPSAFLLSSGFMAGNRSTCGGCGEHVKHDTEVDSRKCRGEGKHSGSQQSMICDAKNGRLHMCKRKISEGLRMQTRRATIDANGTSVKQQAWQVPAVHPLQLLRAGEQHTHAVDTSYHRNCTATNRCTAVRCLTSAPP